ncbi:unnamed protein product, partial [Mesorhabditis belari]|uniref:SAYSvFN domain-containing protein n=1 Tax=Mesorhabditis belari TaxID=2138241 RepID=A0AAF3FRP0_9BILA
MEKARQQLEEFRRRQLEEKATSSTERIIDKLPPVQPRQNLFSKLFSIDVLNILPFRVWRSSYDRNPSLIAICLGLGQRKDGEISAYSVFNENCERLLGQMTAEHFERDVLQKRRPQ